MTKLTHSLRCFVLTMKNIYRYRKYQTGKYHCTVDLLFDRFGISCMTTDNFCFYLQHRLIQTSQTGGQRYSDTSSFSIPWKKIFDFSTAQVALHGHPFYLLNGWVANSAHVCGAILLLRSFSRWFYLLSMSMNEFYDCICWFCLSITYSHRDHSNVWVTVHT